MGGFVPARILHVAYYPSLLETRDYILRTAGYQVTSVLGNSEAMALDDALMAASDLIVVGFSAPRAMRADLVRWFKQRHPRVPVVVLKFHEHENFPEADAQTLSEDPQLWLQMVASALLSGAR